MKILLSVHLYVPQHGAGGERYMHNMAKYLITQGHQVRVLLHESAVYNIKQVYVYEGVEVFPRLRNLEEHFLWADRILTHLGYTQWTIAVAKVFRKPVFFVVHNTHVYSCVNDPHDDQQIGIIYNCQHAKDELNYPHPSLVLPPMVDWREYDMNLDTETHPYITLVNLNENKGGHILYKIARAMPDKQFLAVKGGYDPQIIEDVPNVRIVDNTPEIKTIYAQTRVLIMPSEYESWGMCATEAMCNGIPVVCTPTFGLKENCDNAGMFVKDRNDIQSWVKKIRQLDDKNYYLRRSKLVRQRSRQLDPQKMYESLNNFVTNME